MPLMLMRNLNPKMGLCNGTRLIFKKVHNNHLLECTIVGGEHKDRTRPGSKVISLINIEPFMGLKIGLTLGEVGGN